jgi:predicted metal-binding membrane protein
MMTTTRTRSAVPPIVVAAIAGAWALALIAALTGAGSALHHHELIEHGPPVHVAVGVFIAAWQAHIAAMMLPSSLPLVALFASVSNAQAEPWRARLAFHGGYAAIWTGFGLLAFVGDVAVHEATHRFAWLSDRPWLIAGSVLAAAGLFQFSGLKQRCLQECRHPSGFLFRYYRHGAAAAFEIGARHGLFCVGCCGALMILMFAVGIANLAWMAPLTLAMVFEKAVPGGHRLSGPVGIALLALATAVLARPAWAQWLGFGG